MASRLRMQRWLPVIALVAAGPAGAASISGLSIVKNGGNTADGGTGNTAVSSAVQTLSSTATTFSTRYSFNAAADTGAFGSTTTQNFTANYTITFSVTHANAVPYQINVGTRLTGGLTYIDDAVGAGGNGAASDMIVNNITGTRTGGASQTGALGLTVTPAGAAGGSSTSGVDVNVNNTGAATIFAVGTGGAQVYTLNFSWTGKASSTCSGLCVSGGDEKALRFGAPGFADSGGFLANTTADNYPGAGGLARTQSNDGHFINVTVIPEPGSLVLLAVGLAGLARTGRRRA